MKLYFLNFILFIRYFINICVNIICVNIKQSRYINYKKLTKKMKNDT